MPHNRRLENRDIRIWYISKLGKGAMKLNKSDIKQQNTLGHLDQYMCWGLKLWNSRDWEVVQPYKYVQRMETVKQWGLWSSFGSHGCYVFSLSSGKFIYSGGETKQI